MSDPVPTIKDMQRVLSQLSTGIKKFSAGGVGRACYRITQEVTRIREGLRRRHQQRASFTPPHVPHVSGYDLTCSTCGKSPEEH